MNYQANIRREFVANLVVSGANTVVFRPGFPVDVKRIILVNTVAQTVNDVTLTLALRKAAAATGSVTKGTVTVPFLNSAIGDVRSIEVVKPLTTPIVTTDGAKLNKGYGPGGPILMDPTLELAMTISNPAGAGAYDVHVEYHMLGWSGPQVVSPTYAVIQNLVFTGQ